MKFACQYTWRPPNDASQLVDNYAKIVNIVFSNTLNTARKIFYLLSYLPNEISAAKPMF